MKAVDVFMVTEAPQRANVKYRNKAYDRLEITIPKGRKEAIKDYAASKDESVNSFLNRIINQEMGLNAESEE